MYNVTTAVKNLFNSGARQTFRISFTGKYETFQITNEDIVQGGLSIDRYCVSGEKLEVGSAVAAELRLKIANYSGIYDDVIFEDGELYVEVGVGDPVTYVPCGRFIIDTPPRTQSVINISALDRMVKFDKVWSSITFPITVGNLVARICTNCGVTLETDISGKPNYSYSITSAPAADVTYRRLIQWCAFLMGTCAYMDHNGKLAFGWYTTASYSITSSMRMMDSTDMYENDITVTGLKYTASDGTVTNLGSSTYVLSYEGCDILQSNASTALNNVYNAVKNLTYRPFSCDVFAAPFVWPLDKITYVDKGGTSHTTVVTNITYVGNGATSLCAAKDTAAIANRTQGSNLTVEQKRAIAEAVDALPVYTWTAYADNSSGGGISLSPTGKAYMGTAVNRPTETPDISNPSVYSWVKVEGGVGPQGPQGETGEAGVSPTVTITEGTDSHTVTITDAQGTQSTTILDGEQGPRGETGPRGATGATGSTGPQGETGPQGADSNSLLLDVYAPSLTKINGPSDRYLSDAARTETTGAFIEEANLPDANATHFYRITYGNGTRGLAWYVNNFVPLQDGVKYIIGCYARKHAGNPKVNPYIGNFGYDNVGFNVTDEWQWYEKIVDFRDTGDTAQTFKRAYFYCQGASGDALDMCGFRVSRAEENVGNGDNLLLKSDVPVSNQNYNLGRFNFGDDKPLHGDVVTLTFKGTLGTGKTGWGIYNSGGQVSMFEAGNPLSNLWYDSSEGVYKVTFTWKEYNPTGTQIGNNTYLNIYAAPNSVTGVTSSIEWIKLERGTAFTGWNLNSSEVNDMIEEAQTTATNALTSANGKNSIYYSLEEPTGTFKEGDTWFQQGSVSTYGTESGDIVTFKTTEAKALQEVVVDIEPVQSGEGTPSPSNVRPISGWDSIDVHLSPTESGGTTYTTEFSFFPVIAAGSQTASGVTITSDGRGNFTLIGTATADGSATFNFASSFVIPDGSDHYILLNNSQVVSGNLAFYNGSTQVDTWVFSVVNREYTGYVGMSGKTATAIRFNVVSGATYNMTCSPKFQTVLNHAKGIPSIVYGGTLDVVSGVLTVDREYVNLTADNWTVWNNTEKAAFTNNIYSGRRVVNCNSLIPDSSALGGIYVRAADGRLRAVPQWAQSCSSLADFKTALANNAEINVVLSLATPVTYQLTPAQITTLVGTNNIWGDGSITVTGPIVETDASTEVFKWDGTSWVESPLADAAFAHIDAGTITTGVLRTITLIGPSSKTFWDLSTGEWQNHGNIDVDYYWSPSGGDLEGTWNIDLDVHIQNGAYTIVGSHTNTESNYSAVVPVKETTYIDFGIQTGFPVGAPDYGFTDFDGFQEPFAYAGFVVSGDRIKDRGIWYGEEGGVDYYDTGKISDVYWTPTSWLTPTSLVLGAPKDCYRTWNPSDSEIIEELDGEHQAAFNTLEINAGAVNVKDSIIFRENVGLSQGSSGLVRTFRNNPYGEGVVHPYIYRPVWPYMPGDSFTTLSNYPVVCTGYTTSNNALLRFFIPVARPIGHTVTSVTISTGTFNVRHEGNYIVGTSNGGTQSITEFTTTIRYSGECGVIVDVSRPANGWLVIGTAYTTNNRAAIVSIYGFTIRFN